MQASDSSIENFERKKKNILVVTVLVQLKCDVFMHSFNLKLKNKKKKKKKKKNNKKTNKTKKKKQQKKQQHCHI